MSGALFHIYINVKTSNFQQMKKDTVHLANKTRWEAAADNWAAAADSRGKWKKCHEEPSIVFIDKTLEYLKGIEGKNIAVLGSGDNEVVFALAGMGANVTSIDISQGQLDHAAKRAMQLDLEVKFVQHDVTDLQSIRNEQFDLVYTGGHVAVWVADLEKYYHEASRILKPGGLFIVEEYHPFRRVWKASASKLEVGYDYFDKGPFKFYYNDNVLYPKKGELPSFEFHWTISDFCTAVLKSGCNILDLYEYGNTYESWEVAPMKGLPEILTIISRKK